jgi:hypothetical protein
MTTEDVVRAYVAAVEAQDLDEVQNWLHDQVEVIEHPNAVSPNGRRYGKTELREAGERGKALMASEDYKIVSAARPRDEGPHLQRHRAPRRQDLPPGAVRLLPSLS